MNPVQFQAVRFSGRLYLTERLTPKLLLAFGLFSTMA